MVAETSTSQLRSWINNAQPEELLTIAPAIMNRLGSLDDRQQERFCAEVQNDPQAKRVFDKMQTYSR